jgi:oligopeptide/dipeptide ABC transporter ATP-binding protein
VPSDEIVLRATGLTRHYPVRGGLLQRERGQVHAVDGVDLTLHAGETLAIVGESGCGKSTLARMLALLDPPTAGDLELLGTATAGLRERHRRSLRREVQMVFQDPYTSLNPRMTVRSILREPFDVHGDLVPRRERNDRVADLLETVGLKADFADRYPHQFSGGQRQRIGIARALALRPKVVVCDEPVSALDVSVQAQVINLLSDLKAALGIAFVFVSHDLGVVRQIADRVAVMYLGRIAETGGAESVLDDPQHPYTAALLSASPAPEDVTPRPRIVLRGEPPTPIDPPSGCRFHPRCWKATAVCAELEPAPSAAATPGVDVACHHPGPPYFADEV